MAMSTAGEALFDLVAGITAAPERFPVITRERHETPVELRRAVLNRDHWYCRTCDYPTADGVRLQVDHIVAASAGGSDATDNLRVLCARCNARRSNFIADAHAVRVLLIVGDCSSCQPPTFDDDGDTRTHDRDEPCWCTKCGASWTTARHALQVRAWQAALHAMPGANPWLPMDELEHLHRWTVHSGDPFAQWLRHLISIRIETDLPSPSTEW